MITIHVSGSGWIVVGLATGILISAGYVLGFYDAKAKIIARLMRIL